MFEDQRIVILDGSMGRLLKDIHGLPADDLFMNLWASAALVKPEFHEKVVKVHKSFLESGADLITTNSYAIQPYYYRRGEALMRKNLDGISSSLTLEQIMANHAKLSVALAIKAKVEFVTEQGASRVPKVLGSIGPICESHRPDLYDSFIEEEGVKKVRSHFVSLAGALIEGGCDGIILETMNSWEEAEMALAGVQEWLENNDTTAAKSIPIIVSMEGAIRDKEDFVPNPKSSPEIAKKLLALKSKTGLNIVGLGFNCVTPNNILDALKSIRENENLFQEMESAGVRLVAYANMFQDIEKIYDSGYKPTNHRNRKTFMDKRDDYTEFASKFIEAGATVIGGCCGSTPSNIQALRALQDHGGFMVHGEKSNSSCKNEKITDILTNGDCHLSQKDF